MRLVVVVVCAALLAACGRSAPSAPPSPSAGAVLPKGHSSDDADRPLLGTRWVVVRRANGGPAKDVPVGVAYLIFSRNGLVGVTGCSGLAATIEMREGAFAVEPVHRSDQPCDGEIAELDASVMATLSGVVQVHIKGPELVLTGPAGDELVLRDQDALLPSTAGAGTSPTQEPPSQMPMGGVMG